MTVGEAQALAGPALQSVEYEPAKDMRSLEALARWLTTRFSPTVAIEGNHALLLDITGCERLFHGTHNLVRQVCAALDRMRVRADVAVASTPGAAYALAFSRCDRLVVPPDEPLADVLAKLPIEALRLDADAVRTLHHLGVDTIGQLQALPRNALPARFGGVLLTRLDQALGRIDEPLLPVQTDPALSDGIEFDGSVPTLEVVWIAMREILDRMAAELLSRGRGARRVEISIARPYDPAIYKTILLSRPSRDAKAIFNLARCAIENDDSVSLRQRARGLGDAKGATATNTSRHFSHPHPSPFPQEEGDKYNRIRWETEDGFTAITIDMPVTQRVTESQISLRKHREEAGEEEFDRLLERLHARLGDETILKPELSHSYLPEHAYQNNAAIDRAAGSQPAQTKLNHGPETSILRSARPTYLLPTPIEVGVIVAPSDEGDGPPISFSLGQRVHRLLHSSTLERLGCRWWDGHLKTRDYFEAEDATTGKRFWLFRVFETGRWFVHGVFD